MAIEIREMDDKEWEEFEFWSDYSRSLQDGEIPMAHGWPKGFPARLGKATEYAAEKHHWKARKGTFIPYMSHLMAVASLVYEMGGDPDQVIAALLHDVVEDTDTTLDEIKTKFGDAVAQIVESCSNSINKTEKEEPWSLRKARGLTKLSRESKESLVVSLADKLHNARSIVRDAKAHGSSFWSRFSANPVKIATYYDAIAKIFTNRRNEGSEMFRLYVDEFIALATEIRQLAAASKV